MRSEAFAIFIIEFYFFLPPMLLVGVALAYGCAIQRENSSASEKLLQESLYKNTLYENTVQKPTTWNTPSPTHRMWSCTGNLGWSSSVESTSYVGPALEMLDEVHQSNPLLMWSYTRNLWWSSISPIQWILWRTSSSSGTMNIQLLLLQQLS